MEKVTEFNDIAIQSLKNMWLEITKVFPTLIYALIALIVGWLVTKILVKLLKKLLRLAKANKLDDKLNDIEIIENKTLKFDTIKIVSNFVKWLLYIVIFITVSDILFNSVIVFKWL